MSSPLLALLLLTLAAIAHPAFAQVNMGELRLTFTDPTGQALKAQVTISNGLTRYQKSFTTTSQLDLPNLPYGLYLIRAELPGFRTLSQTVEIRSALPTGRTFILALAGPSTSVQVTSTAPLIDPDRPNSVERVGSAEIQDRVTSLPGRSVQDLVNSQPGWLYEGNAVLHPRGSEYQTQFVLDGIPLTDNRSPSFGPEIEADDLDSLTLYTAGIPAEYGRKLGGVIELNTRRDLAQGLHAQTVLSGGSYSTASAYLRLQDVAGPNTFSLSASGSMSAHYLNPVVPENFTNRGTTGDFSLGYARDLTSTDRLSLDLRHALSRFEIPNELVQQQAGQRQTGNNAETFGSLHFRHMLSPDALFTLATMVRDTASGLDSNPLSTPILATQRNDFREIYFKATWSQHLPHQELKAGLESDALFLHEHFAYTLTDPTRFDPGTPLSPTPFTAANFDLEPSAFLEDLLRLGPWTLSAGLRYDHYQLLLNRYAFSPRLSLSRSLPSLNLVLHASLDRIFQTPSFENILITSSTWIQQINPSTLHLPVQPSRGTYYEGGLTQSYKSRARLDLNLYRRDVRNYADDDQLLNTGISYPIAFDKAVIYGAEAKLTLVSLGPLSGSASYSYMVGNAWFPVTGGLFLGDDANSALTQTTGHFPDSQDQRNTLRTRVLYQIFPRLFLATGANYGSGLPFAFTGTQADALAQYGPQVVDRINFTRGRILPLLAVNASLGLDLYTHDKLTTRLQADGDNLNNRLNVIDFGGLFSGNAIAPARSFLLRLSADF